MSYTPTNWKTGDVVTSAKLNKLEQGVADAGGGSSGGGVLVVNITFDGNTETMDKTWQEIHDAADEGLPITFKFANSDGIFYLALSSIEEDSGYYGVYTYNFGSSTTFEYGTNSASGYPTHGG